MAFLSFYLLPAALAAYNKPPPVRSPRGGKARSASIFFGNMPFQIITIPFDPALQSFSEDLLNDFLLNKKLISWQAEFFQHSHKAFWTVFLEYEPVLKNDGREKFNFTKEQEVLFQRFREWRKETAEKQGVPVYVIASNQHLSEMVIKQPDSLESLKQIRGFGEKKVAEYGKEILQLIQTFKQKE